MSTKIKATIEDKDYVFELDRKECIRLEQTGFNAQLVESQPLTQLTKLFVGGLHKNHSNINELQALALYDKFIEEGYDISELVSVLLEQYAAFFQTTQSNSSEKKKLIIEK